MEVKQPLERQRQWINSQGIEKFQAGTCNNDPLPGIASRFQANLFDHYRLPESAGCSSRPPISTRLGRSPLGQPTSRDEGL